MKMYSLPAEMSFSSRPELLDISACDSIAGSGHTVEHQRYLRVQGGTILPCLNRQIGERGEETPCQLVGIEIG